MLPPDATAFYLYVEPWDTRGVRVTTDTGVTSEFFLITSCGAGGFGFYTDQPNETIQTVLVEVDDTDFFIAEFGISNVPVAVELQELTVE